MIASLASTIEIVEQNFQKLALSKEDDLHLLTD